MIPLWFLGDLGTEEWKEVPGMGYIFSFHGDEIVLELGSIDGLSIILNCIVIFHVVCKKH